MMQVFQDENFSRFLIGTMIIAVFVIRLSYVFYWSGRPFQAPQLVTTLIILGSGGHTAEMLDIVNVFPKDKFVPRFYIAATTDTMSIQKARFLEESLFQKEKASDSKRISEVAHFHQIYRSREVGQSYLTSVGTSLIALVHGLWLILKIKPHVIICNGPGTCIPLCIAAFLIKVAGIKWASIFYIESIARVRRLSLSGLLLYKLRLADQFYVQWPQLQKAYPRAHHVGCLM